MGNHNGAQSRGAKKKDSYKSPPTEETQTQSSAHKPAHASELALADTQAHTHTHTLSSQKEEGERGKVTQGASSSFSQAGYLQRLVLRQPGETSPGPRQCLGGA